MDLDQTFDSNYYATTVATVEDADMPIRHFSGVTVEDELGLIAAIYPVGQPPWVGRFTRGTGIGSSATGLWSLPNPDEILVCSWGQAFQINVFDTDEWRPLDDVHPVMHVLPARNAAAVVVGDYSKLAAYGAGGLRWRTPDLSWDGLFDLEVDGEELRGHGWSAPDDASVPFRVDLSTGDARGGANPQLGGLMPL